MMKRNKIVAILKAITAEAKTGIDVYFAPAKAAAACIVAMARSALGDRERMGGPTSLPRAIIGSSGTPPNPAG